MIADANMVMVTAKTRDDRAARRTWLDDAEISSVGRDGKTRSRKILSGSWNRYGGGYHKAKQHTVHVAAPFVMSVSDTMQTRSFARRCNYVSLLIGPKRSLGRNVSTRRICA